MAAELCSENVIRIYDLSEADGVEFITMEYIEGVNVCNENVPPRPVTVAHIVRFCRRRGSNILPHYRGSIPNHLRRHRRRVLFRRRFCGEAQCHWKCLALFHV